MVKFCNIVLFISLFPCVARTVCTIPPNITVHAADRCAAWTRFEAAWSEANKKMAYRDYILAPLKEPIEYYRGTGLVEFPWTIESYTYTELSGMGRLTVEERPGTRFTRNGQTVLGTFVYIGSSAPLLIYARDAGWDALPHEIGHWLWWFHRVRLGDGFYNVGHGTPDDPYDNIYRIVDRILYCAYAWIGKCQDVLGAELTDSYPIAPQHSQSEAIRNEFEIVEPVIIGR